jgi:hypothetical protein
MIRMSVTGIAGVIDRLARLPAVTEDGLLRAALRLAADIQTEAERQLSGPALKARTGTLRASLASSVELEAPGIVGRVRASAPYAAFQEYGFSGVESVRAFLRRQTTAFGRPIRPVEVAVRAHARTVDYAGRPFLRTALATAAPTIRAALRQALTEAFDS